MSNYWFNNEFEENMYGGTINSGAAASGNTPGKETTPEQKAKYLLLQLLGYETNLDHLTRILSDDPNISKEMMYVRNYDRLEGQKDDDVSHHYSNAILLLYERLAYISNGENNDPINNYHEIVLQLDPALGKFEKRW